MSPDSRHPARRRSEAVIGSESLPPSQDHASLGLQLTTEQARTLAERIAKAARRATRRRSSTLAGLTMELEIDVDPATVVFASRRVREPWFCFEQRDREQVALGTLGSVVELTARGASRFLETSQAWRRLASEAICDSASFGIGLVAVGGFSFADDGATGSEWRSFPPMSLHVPELALARTAGRTFMTVAVNVAAGDEVESHLAAVARRLAELRHPAGAGDGGAIAAERSSRHSPDHYRSAVATAVTRIRAGELEKVVLAREVDVRAAKPHSTAAVYRRLRERFPSCLVFCVGRGEDAFLAASPELLVRREGLSVSTVALAGSAPRGTNATDDVRLGRDLLDSAKNRGEQSIVQRRIERALRPHCVWVVTAEEPQLTRIANIQHLASAVRGRLVRPISALQLAGILHPTPAVAGEPLARAKALIDSLEGFDRGWYAGAVGWLDGNEDGEFFVSLRSALLSGGLARCYAGVGVVSDSTPEGELAETDFKLEALLPALGLESTEQPSPSAARGSAPGRRAQTSSGSSR
jgi:salicylate biosynthesis isochorismate synthase